MEMVTLWRVQPLETDETSSLPQPIELKQHYGAILLTISVHFKPKQRKRVSNKEQSPFKPYVNLIADKTKAPYMNMVTEQQPN